MSVNHKLHEIKSKTLTHNVNPQVVLNTLHNNNIEKHEVLLAGVNNNGAGLTSINSCVVNNAGEIGVQNASFGHLNAISTNTATTNTKLGTIETDIEATNTALGIIDGVLDNSLLKQTSLETKLGTIETDIETTNTKLTEIDAVLDNSLIQQTAVNTNLGKITRGSGVITAGGDDLQQVLLYGRNGNNGNLEPLETVGDRLLVDVIELSPTGPHTPTSLPSVAIHGQVGTTSGFKNFRVDTNGILSVVDSHLSDDLDLIKRTKTHSTPVNNETVAASGTYESSYIDMRTTTSFGLEGICSGASGFTIDILVCSTQGGTYRPYYSGSIDSSGNITNSTSAGVPPINPVHNFPFKYMKLKVVNGDGLTQHTITIVVHKIQ